MQIFVPFDSAIKSAKCLDRRRLHKQFIEAQQIIRALEDFNKTGDEKVLKHPVYKMYKNYLPWVKYYASVCQSVFLGVLCIENEPERPYFLGFEELHKCHRKRLFQKGLHESIKYNKTNYYQAFEEDNLDNEENIYIVDRKILYYLRGKLVRSEDFDIQSKELNMFNF